MNIRHSIQLLTVSVAAIIGLLFMVAAYTLALNSPPPAATTADTTTTAAATDPLAAGKKVWRKAGCGGCHAKDMRSDLTGPALGGVTNRWADYPREDLFAWIRNNTKLTAAGHPRAVKVSKAYPGVMRAYPELSDGDIEALLGYIEGV